MSNNINKVTPYYLNHIENKAEMLSKGGWLRPKVFTTPEEEVLAVRNGVGLIDAHSMGKFNIVGDDAARFIQFLMTNDLNNIESGQGAIYTCLCNESGGIVDDVVVYYLDHNNIYLITNTLSGPRVKEWLECQKKNLGMVVEIFDTTSTTAYLAVQGPKSEELLKRVTGDDISDLDYFQFKYVDIAGVDVLLARTGYTGEKGYELNYPSAYGYEMWKLLQDQGVSDNVRPIGGAAIQILRSEKAYRSHGTDMFVDSNPYEMGLGWTVKLSKEDFVGKDALTKIKNNGPKIKFTGFTYSGDKVVSVPSKIYLGDSEVGVITTSYWSPALNMNIALGTIAVAHLGTEQFSINVEGERVDLVISQIPFYDPEGLRAK